MADETKLKKPVYEWANKLCPNAHTHMCVGDKCAIFDYEMGMCAQLSSAIRMSALAAASKKASK